MGAQGTGTCLTLVTFNYTEEFLRQAKRLAKRYHSLADDIDALQHDKHFHLLPVYFLFR